MVCCGISVRRVAACVALALYVVTYITESELLQYLQGDSAKFKKPFFLCWLVISAYSWFLLVWAAWSFLLRPRVYPHIPGPTAHHTRRIALFAALLSPIYVISGYFWYSSLNRTSVTGNTMVFGSQTVCVFILAVFILKERVSPLKIVSVALSTTGVFLVVWFASNDAGSQETALGYVFAVISMLLNALYQVLYQWLVHRYTHPAPASASIPATGVGTASDPEYPADNAEDRPLMAQTPPPPSPYPPPAGHLPSSLPPLIDPESSPSSGAYQLMEVDGSSPHPNDTPRMSASFTADSPAPADPHSSTAPAHPMRAVSDSLLFLGCLGLTVLALFWPWLLILDAAGVESLEWPQGRNRGIVVCNAFLDSSMSVFSLAGIAWSSSLFMSVGSVFSLPTSSVADLILHGYYLPKETYPGILCIVAGFLGLNYAEYRIERSSRQRV